MPIRFLIRTIIYGAVLAGSLALTAQADSDPKEKLKDAWNLYRLGEFKSALAEFQELRQIGGESNIHGLYGEGTIWNFRRDARDTKKALAAYKALIEADPGHPLAAWAALDSVRARFLGKGEVLGPRTEEVEAYRQVWRQYPDTLAGQEAFVFQTGLQTYYLRQSWDKPLAEALMREVDDFLQRHPRSGYASHLFGTKAECCRILGRQQERLTYMMRALEVREFDAANPQASKAGVYWTLAYAAEFDAGNFQVARQYYQRIITEYPQDPRVFPCREALKRMDAVEAAIREGRPVTPELLPGGRR